MPHSALLEMNRCRQAGRWGRKSLDVAKPQHAQPASPPASGVGPALSRRLGPAAPNSTPYTASRALP